MLRRALSTIFREERLGGKRVSNRSFRGTKNGTLKRNALALKAEEKAKPVVVVETDSVKEEKKVGFGVVVVAEEGKKGAAEQDSQLKDTPAVVVSQSPRDKEKKEEVSEDKETDEKNEGTKEETNEEEDEEGEDEEEDEDEEDWIGELELEGEKASEIIGKYVRPVPSHAREGKESPYEERITDPGTSLPPLTSPQHTTPHHANPFLDLANRCCFLNRRHASLCEGNDEIAGGIPRRARTCNLSHSG